MDCETWHDTVDCNEQEHGENVDLEQHRLVRHNYLFGTYTVRDAAHAALATRGVEVSRTHLSDARQRCETRCVEMRQL